MKERPIHFPRQCADKMNRAILDGRKTQHRVPVKPQPVMSNRCGIPFFQDGSPVDYRLAPLGCDGDRLWVREAWAPHCDMPGAAIYRCDPGGDYQDTVTDNFRWRPSIHMPRWASRIDLEIASVRVERVQEITEEDALKEGCEREFKADGSVAWGAGLVEAKENFRTLWQSINGNWDANPWVWVYTFRRVK